MADIVDLANDYAAADLERRIEAARGVVAAVDVESQVCDGCSDDGRCGKACQHYASCLVEWQRLQPAQGRRA